MGPECILHDSTLHGALRRLQQDQLVATEQLNRGYRYQLTDQGRTVLQRQAKLYHKAARLIDERLARG
jgi:DNA-binding PadR family transcriptional regulator